MNGQCSILMNVFLSNLQVSKSFYLTLKNIFKNIIVFFQALTLSQPHSHIASLADCLSASWETFLPRRRYRNWKWRLLSKTNIPPFGYPAIPNDSSDVNTETTKTKFLLKSRNFELISSETINSDCLKYFIS